MILSILSVLFAQLNDLYWTTVNVLNVLPTLFMILINSSVFNVEEEDFTIKPLKLANVQKI